MLRKKKIIKCNNFTPLLDFAAFNYKEKEYHVIYDTAGRLYYCDLDKVDLCAHIKYLIDIYGLPRFYRERQIIEIKNKESNDTYILPIEIITVTKMTILSMVGETGIVFTDDNINKNSFTLTVETLDAAIYQMKQNDYSILPTLVLPKAYYMGISIIPDEQAEIQEVSVNAYKKSRNIDFKIPEENHLTK